MRTTSKEAVDDTKSADLDVRELAESIDSGARRPVGVVARLLFVVAFLWSCYQLYVASPLPFVTGLLVIDDTQDRTIHIAFCLFLGFCMYPLLKRSPKNYIPLYDWLLAGLSVVACLYITVFYIQVANRAGGTRTPFELVISIIGVVCVLEITRRVLGFPMTVVTMLFLAYIFLGPYMPVAIAHRGMSLNRAVDHMWLTPEGVFGIAAGVSTRIVFLFVLFGALLQQAGSGHYLIQLSFAMLGHLRGGPAKASVVSSGLTGLISGSTIANIVTTGTFTIPLMKRVGYPDYMAGAIETSASLGGQIMPPVMGAAAFIMTEFIGISYYEVCKHAFVPAVISYIGLYFIVHAEAEKLNMPMIPRKPTPIVHRILALLASISALIILSGLLYFLSIGLKALAGTLALVVAFVIFIGTYLACLWIAEQYPPIRIDSPTALLTLPDTWPTLMAGLHYILPVVVLVWCLMAERFSAGLSIMWAVTSQMFILITQHPLRAVLVGKRERIWPATKRGFSDLVHGMATGARNMVGVAIAMASAGLIIGTVSLTGLGLSMTAIIENMAGGNFMAALVMTAVISIILGMGLPTTANYLVVIAVMGPVIVELASQNGIIVPLVAVHLFVFYFGLLSGTTPPVAIDAFVGAAVARADPVRTAIQSFFYSVRTIILPFMFIFNTELLLIGVNSVFHFLLILVIATAGLVCFSASLQRWFLCRSRLWESALLLVASLTLLSPRLWLDLVQSPFDAVEPQKILSLVENAPNDLLIRLRMRGEKFGGDIGERIMVVQLGKRGLSGEQRLKRASGMSVAVTPDRVSVADVALGSDGEKHGLSAGWEILGVLVHRERIAMEWFYLPAFFAVGLVFVLQHRRKGKARATAEVTSGRIG